MGKVHLLPHEFCVCGIDAVESGEEEYMSMYPCTLRAGIICGWPANVGVCLRFRLIWMLILVTSGDDTHWLRWPIRLLPTYLYTFIEWVGTGMLNKRCVSSQSSL
jgi:hypothetical protein